MMSEDALPAFRPRRSALQRFVSDYGQEIVIGFRPESFAPRGHSLHGADQSLSVNRAVTIAEPLGTETLLFAELGGREVQGKMLNPRVVAPGELLEFTLDLARLHVFDKASGRSLR